MPETVTSFSQLVYESPSASVGTRLLLDEIFFFVLQIILYMNKELKSGDVFVDEFQYIQRILMADSVYLYAETYEKNIGWDRSSNLNSHFTYYGTGVKPFLARHPTYLRNEPYTDEQNSVIRPDLPISIGRSKKTDWKDIPSLTNKEMIDLFGTDVVLNCSKIYVYPKGPKGGRLKATVIIAYNKQSITLHELIIKAASIQVNFNSQIPGGMGLFRSGVNSRCPTYSINDYYMGYMNGNEVYKLDEEGFDWEAYLESAKKRKPFFTYEKTETKGEYQVIFDLNQVAIGKDVFAVQSVLTNKVVAQYLVENEKFILNLSQLPAATYYLGFLRDNEVFQKHESILL